MSTSNKTIWIGSTPAQQPEKHISGKFVPLLGEDYYQISDFDGLESFFMSIVSSSDHWLFLASTGGLTAGRVSSEQALFPYYTVDKVTEASETSGSKTILHVERLGRSSLWEPFSCRTGGVYRVQRNIYKNLSGTAVFFEEINHDLQLTFTYGWRTGERYGFIKTAWLVNTGAVPCQVDLLDGFQNVLPANVTTHEQVVFSNLLDAYKRSELEPETGLGIFTLNSTLTDLAEPSESLMANTAAVVGIDPQAYLLSSDQIERFRTGQEVQTETEIRGQRGAYLVRARLELQPGVERRWHIVADVSQDHSRVIEKMDELRGDRNAMMQSIEQDIKANQANLDRLVETADGSQHTADEIAVAHHYANVMFNIMRGGVFANQYCLQKADFRRYIQIHSPKLLTRQKDFFAGLPETLSIGDLQARASQNGSPDLVRLCASYLPLTFSRRHGDPSRPWNRFQINVKNSDGSQRLDYEGNWRDIFQNWEALAWSFPGYVDHMLAAFLNSTTVDGYNPYRVTYSGIDWEIPEPGNPWANIGYWSDHQIIYLEKLMEISAKVHPGKLQRDLARPVYSYGNVPYRIKPYADLLKDAYNTIDFDWSLQKQITERVKEMGTDGKLVCGPDGAPLHASLAEKLLTLLLAKLSNLVPEGGIWMSTQRPEWNDANNALVGKGLSVVTLCYLRRFLVFCSELFEKTDTENIPVRREVVDFCRAVESALLRHRPLLSGSLSDEQRKTVMDELGQAGSNYRWGCYSDGFSGQVEPVAVPDILRFFELAQEYIDHSLIANRRDDHLYHSYNTLSINGAQAGISHLYEMLEGQVAILSSGLLSGREALDVLNAMKNSRLYQAERNTYILYPDREIKGFLEKNRIEPEKLANLKIAQALHSAGDTSLLVRDGRGAYHFNGKIRNIKGVDHALELLKANPQFTALVEQDRTALHELFEEVFKHAEFTGRSSTFFAYEGLGSIYWHMVAKLLLAAGENAVSARLDQTEDSVITALVDRYRDIRSGLGYHKTPEQFGSFTTDPYSHSPRGRGAKQPGMTGQVKEEILTRRMEVGCFVREGQLEFDPFLLEAEELLTETVEYRWRDVSGHDQSLAVPSGSLVITVCQTPVILKPGPQAEIDIHYADRSVDHIPGKRLTVEISRHIFERDGMIRHLVVSYKSSAGAG